MELRLDRLLERLRTNAAEILRVIDTDPLLTKREIGGLVLANASKALFTPQEEHQLFAKGIVYTRNPYQLVSLPLIKIYNLGEKEFQLPDLAKLAQSAAAKIRFLRKLDGSMIQRFEHAGRVWFSTRGMLEGLDPMAGMADEDTPERLSQFDYIGTAKAIAEQHCRILLEPSSFQNRTLIFELIHPEARIITNYGARRALVLLAVLDHREMRYWRYDEVRDFALASGFECTDAITPAGNTLADQIDDLLQSLAGTDQEGAVLTVENSREVVYRVKVKSADYLRLFRLMVRCSYRATAEMLDQFAEVPEWDAFEKHLQSLGSESVPEEFLDEYRKYYGQYRANVAECERIVVGVKERTAAILGVLSDVVDLREKRKQFAAKIAAQKQKALYFYAYDGRLDWRRVRELM